MATATTETRHSRSLPRAIRRGLRRLRPRLRAVGAMRGLGKAAMVLAVTAILAMAADVALVVPVAVRWTMWVAWIATAAIATLTGVVRPLLQRLTWNGLAALAERGEPALGEWLTSAVGLLHQPHGSPELIAAVVEDATERAGQVDFTRAVSTRGPLLWLMAGAVAAALAVLPAVVKPEPFAQIGKRFLIPWADINRVGRFAIEVLPGDKVVALGSDVTVSAAVRSRFGEAAPGDPAWLEWSGTDGQPNRAKMTAGDVTTEGQRTFAVTLSRLTGSLTYRAVASGDASRRHRITAIDRPAIASLKAQVEPPSYTKRSSTPARDATRIEAWEDSRVTLAIEASRPLEQAELIWPVTAGPTTSKSGAAPSRVVALTPGDDAKTWSATVVAEASGPFAIRLRDEYNLENKPDAAFRVVVRPDAPPALAIAAPDEFKETSADDYLTVAVAARDDVAVAWAELRYTIERSEGSKGLTSGSVAAPLDGLGTVMARGEGALSLRTLGLKPGDVLSYRVCATDNRPPPRGPNITWSGTHRLRIIEHSESLKTRQQTAQREALRARLEAIQKATAANRQQTDQLRNRADQVRRGQGGWHETNANELTKSEAAAREVSDQLQILSRDLLEHATFHPLGRPAHQLAEVESEAARGALTRARRATDPARRHAELELAGTRLGTMTWKVDELKRKFDELARLDDDRRRLTALSQREDDLAARTAQAGDRAQLAAIDEEQERLRRELDEVLKGSPALRAEVLAAQAREADALAARARALALQQREEARRTAADGPRSAAVKALADTQRALEDDARRLAIRLDEPLAQNSRGRVDVDTLARAGDAIERGDLDAARDRSRDAENALDRLSRDLEDVRNDPKALARRLVRRQEDLKNETVEAVRASRDHPPQTPEGKAALTDRLKPLIERQEAISRLASSIAAPPEQKDAARDAAQKTARARDDLRDARPRDVEGHQNEARDALNRLAEALPDPNQRRDQVRQKLAEARSRYEEIARDLDNHLRETAPKAGQAHDRIRSATELAQRVAPLARREREVAEALSALNPEPRALPQRDRATRRVVEFADALETVRQQAPTAAPLETKSDEPRPLAPPEVYRPVADWRVVGPFPSGNKPPFATDSPVDLNRQHGDRKGQPASWRAARPANDKGAIDLASHFATRDNGTAAFGYAELKSPAKRQARMLIGSNDTFTVWLNGKQVYDSQISRSWAPDHARIDVPLAKGINRILVKCGNTGGKWMYSVALSEDPARANEKIAEALAHKEPDFEHLRDALPALQVAARSALDRLQQKVDGKTPADELAALLAADERDLKSAAERTPADDAGAVAALAADQRRIASAVANLDVPDAPLAKAEAIARAEEAARALEAPASDVKRAHAHAAIARAIDAATALARRLGDEQSPRDRARDLARAQRSLAGSSPQLDPTDQARQERAIADELARLAVENKREAAQAVVAAAELSEQAARFDGGPHHDAAKLAAARERAARALDKLAASLDGVPAAKGRGDQTHNEVRAIDDPALGVTPADQVEAAVLAQRQRHIREGLQAILGESSASQRALRARSTALGREVADLRDRAKDTSSRAHGPAHTAADLLGRAAPETMDRAAVGLQEGRPGDALQAQRQATDLAEQAARQTEDLGAALRADRPPDMADHTTDGFAAAQAAARAAGQHLAQARAPAQSDTRASQAAIAAAAAAMRQAAQGLRASDRSPIGASRSFGLAQTANDPRGPAADLGSPDLSGLKAAVRAATGRTWGVLPGHLRAEILQMTQGRYRDDYAPLIELYFREIASDAGERGVRP